MSSTIAAKEENDLDIWANSPWLHLICKSATRDPLSREEKKFRRKFRLPYKTFEKLIDLCPNDPNFEGEPLFSYGHHDVCQNQAIPLELKVLMVLRVLGGGLSFLDASELSGISETECHRFFHKFNEVFCTQLKDRYIKALEGNIHE